MRNLCSVSTNHQEAILTTRQVIEAVPDSSHAAFAFLGTPAVPEPSAWMMLLLGFGGVRFMSYHALNAEVLAGKIAFTPHSSCAAAGVPAFHL